MHKLKVIGFFTFGKNSTFVESRFLSTHNGIGWGTTKPFSSSSSFFSKWRKSHFSPPSFDRRTERWEMGTINAKPQTQKGCNAGGSCNKEAVKFSNFSSLGAFWKEKKKSKLGNWGNLSTDAFFLKKSQKGNINMSGSLYAYIFIVPPQMRSSPLSVALKHHFPSPHLELAASV